MGDTPTFHTTNLATTFHQFPSLPTEVRLKIWHHALPPPQIIYLKAHHGYALLPALPRFPPSILALLHTNHEVRSEVLNCYQLLLFPVQAIRGTHYSVPTYTKALPSSDYRSNCWPAPRAGLGRNRLESRWECRGCYIVNIRSDLVFFSRWCTRDLARTYGSGFCAALVLALSEVRFLSISMHSWKESRAGWLDVLRQLDNLREVVFVRESFVFASPAQSWETSVQLLNLEEVDVAPYEFSGELWRARILADIAREQKIWPEWKVPSLEFKAITDRSERNGNGETVMWNHFRKLRPGDSWRK